MSLRKSINEHPRIAGTVAGTILLVAIVVSLLQLRGDPGGASDINSMRTFYTVDDGKTYFPDMVDRLPPFTTAEGKTAYRAVVVKCGDGAPYVSHLERYSDTDKKNLLQALENPTARPTILAELESNASGRAQVKKPLTGDRGWVSPGAPTYPEISQPKCKDGSDAERVRPSVP